MNNTVKEMQKIILEMLKLFLEICQKNKLRYFLIDGSCLGAVRHKGFIPWDDDIDIGMPRKDYDIFLKIAQHELPDGYFLQFNETDKHYVCTFAKIRNSNTTFIEKSVSHLDINHGVFLDIFPLDGYKESTILNILKTKYSFGILKFIKPSSFMYSFRRFLHNLLLLNFCMNYEKYRDKMDKIIKKYDYDGNDLIQIYCGAWEIVPREYFGTGIEGEFEGLKVMLPEKYDLYLTNVYGDYMKLPPEDERVTHHHTSVIDLNKPYTYYIKKEIEK